MDKVVLAPQRIRGGTLRPLESHRKIGEIWRNRANRAIHGHLRAGRKPIAGDGLRRLAREAAGDGHRIEPAFHSREPHPLLPVLHHHFAGLGRPRAHSGGHVTEDQLAIEELQLARCRVKIHPPVLQIPEISPPHVPAGGQRRLRPLPFQSDKDGRAVGELETADQFPGRLLTRKRQECMGVHPQHRTVFEAFNFLKHGLQSEGARLVAKQPVANVKPLRCHAKAGADPFKHLAAAVKPPGLKLPQSLDRPFLQRLRPLHKPSAFESQAGRGGFIENHLPQGIRLQERLRQLWQISSRVQPETHVVARHVPGGARFQHAHLVFQPQLPDLDDTGVVGSPG